MACGCGRCRSRGKLPRGLVKVYVVSCIVFFTNAFAVTMLFPFLPFMVEFLLPWLAENKELIATYAGYIASGVFFGRIPGSYVWGAIADSWGRKPVVIVGLILVGLTSAVFGFSVSFEMALILRILAGLFNGVPGTIKAVVSEVSDNSTQGFGIALVGVAWGLGIIVGPAVSGVISDPIGQYNLTIDNPALRDLLTRFPFSLPCLLSALLCVLSIVLVVFILPETLDKKSKAREGELTESTSQSNSSDSADHTVPLEQVEHDDNSQGNNKSICQGCSTTSRGQTPRAFNEAESQSELGQEDMECPTSDLSSPEDGDQVRLLTVGESGDMDTCTVKTRNSRRDKLRGKGIKFLQWTKTLAKNLYSMLRDKSVFLSIVVYSAISAVDIGFNDIYAVWAKTLPHLGGLGFSLNEIGVTLTISSVLLLPVNLVVFPLVESKIGLLKSYYLWMSILIPTIMLLPNIHYLYNNKWVLLVLLCIILCIIQACFILVFNSSALFINNSVPFSRLGSVNGLTIALSSISRGLAALVSGRIFSLSLQATAAGLSYPLDYRLLFLLYGLIFVVCVLLVNCLPVSINKMMSKRQSQSIS